LVSDHVTNSDVFERLVNYLRTFSELQSLSDFTTAVVDKASLDTVVTAEQKQFNTSKPLQDSSTSTDTPRLSFSTDRADSLNNTTDNFSSQWNAVRVQAETVNTAELFKLNTDKSVTETANTAELLQKTTTTQYSEIVNTAETFVKDATVDIQELVDATDDFYGAANLDDDQIATVNKNVADHVINSETITTLTDFKRSVNESQILSEVFAAVTNKALSDITNSSDTVTLLTAPNKRETVSTSQTISLTLQSYFSQDYVELGYTGETYTY